MLQPLPAKGMKCVECGEISPISLETYTKCHYVVAEPVYNPPSNLRERIERGPQSLYRYLDLIPNSRVPGYEVGMTPLVRERFR